MDGTGAKTVDIGGLSLERVAGAVETVGDCHWYGMRVGKKTFGSTEELRMEGFLCHIASVVRDGVLG